MLSARVHGDGAERSVRSRRRVTALAKELACASRSDRRHVAARRGAWTRGVRRRAGSGASVTPDMLVSADGKSFLLTVSYVPFADTAAPHTRTNGSSRLIKEAASTLAIAPHPTVRVYSNPLLYNDFSTQIEKDLVTGEAVALPIALLVMVLVFGGFLAASAPLIGAFASIAGGLAVLFGFSYPIKLDQSAINVVDRVGHRPLDRLRAPHRVAAIGKRSPGAATPAPTTSGQRPSR